MLGSDNIVRAFSEEHAERLTGLTSHQLRYWDKTGFFAPSYAEDNRRVPYGRIYSFRDVVGLKTLGILRNTHHVPLQHLRQVAKKLAHLKDRLWSKTTLYVSNRRVIFPEEGTHRPRDVLSGQYVMGLALKAVMSDVENDCRKLRDRFQSQIGKIERNRFVSHNAWVIAGTRIPIRSIRRFHDAGYTVQQILQEYPDLTKRDIEAALAHEEGSVAAA